MSNSPDDTIIIRPPQGSLSEDRGGVGAHGRNGLGDRRFLTRPEAAEYLREIGFPITKGTLMKYATTGGGPRFQKFGTRALYTPDELIAWAEAKLSGPMTSTSEAAA